MGYAVRDDERTISGGHRAVPRQLRGSQTGLQREETGPLVYPLSDGARRSRGRVFGPLVAVDLRRVPAQPGQRRRTRAADPGARGAECLSPDLDDDAVDDSLEPGHRVPPRVRLRGLPGG